MMLINFSLSRKIITFFILIIICTNFAFCDLPVHCKREQIEGEWTFRINKDKFNPEINDYKTSCGHGFPDKIETNVGDINFSFENYNEIKIKLGSDYKVYETNTNSDFPVGNWTPVYDEGFILNYKEQVFTAFMKYYLKENTEITKPSKNLYSSNCKKTMIGWYIENKEFNNKNWSCFFGYKTQIENEFLNKKNFLKPNKNKKFNNFDYKLSNNNNNNDDDYDKDDIEINSFLEIKSRNKSNMNMKIKTLLSKYEEQKEIIKEINESNLPWKAEINEEFKGLSFIELKEKI